MRGKSDVLQECGIGLEMTDTVDKLGVAIGCEP
jgi:hypothetical protein